MLTKYNTNPTNWQTQTILKYTVLNPIWLCFKACRIMTCIPLLFSSSNENTLDLGLVYQTSKASFLPSRLTNIAPLSIEPGLLNHGWNFSAQPKDFLIPVLVLENLCSNGVGTLINDPMASLVCGLIHNVLLSTMFWLDFNFP